MFETYSINYELNGGTLPAYRNKQELKECFLKSYYDFVCFHDQTFLQIDFKEIMKMTPSLVGSIRVNDKLMNQYYVNDSFHNNGQLVKQDATSFIGYCLINGLFMNTIGHLLSFFYRWRDLEEVDGTEKEKAIDFFFISWASIVDTCKYFDYNEPIDIAKGHDSLLCSRDLAILSLLKTVPMDDIVYPYKTCRHTDIILPIPQKAGYTFAGWYLEATFENKTIVVSKMQKEPITLYAKWV